MRTHYQLIVCHIAAVLMLLLSGCAKESLVDEEASKGMPIGFGMNRGAQYSPSLRSGLTDYSINDFLVYGAVKVKATASDAGAFEPVFNNYKVWHSATGSSTNTSNWEYVGEAAANQVIKYWDYTCEPYVFWGLAPAGERTFTPAGNGGVATCTVTGVTAAANASGCLYYTDPIPVKKANYSKPVTMNFKCTQSRIRFAFYETVAGYAVKDVMFYDNSDAESVNCWIGGKFVTEGNLTLTYDMDADNGFANPATTMAWGAEGTTTATAQQFGALNYTFPNDNLLQGTEDADKVYLSQVSTAPTYAGSNSNPGYYVYILPYPSNDKPMTVKCDYTLVSTDGTNQQIRLTGKTATVPVEYCQWKSNYSYTYVFKFTADELTPIVFEAYSEVVGTDNNQQGTVTTFGEYSLTTTQAGDTDADGITYVAGTAMDVTAILSTGAEMGKVALDGTNDYVVIYHQETPYEWIVGRKDLG